jgi:hypothetical protein
MQTRDNSGKCNVASQWPAAAMGDEELEIDEYKKGEAAPASPFLLFSLQMN